MDKKNRITLFRTKDNKFMTQKYKDKLRRRAMKDRSQEG